MSDKLLVTKLHIPSSRSRAVPRTRLTEQLDKGVKARVVVVSAPAGSGKTSLLAEWCAQNGKQAAWLSLDKNDNELAVFLAYMVEALRGLRPGVGEEVLGLLRAARPAPGDELLTMLINEIASFPNDFALVLDDYHLIESDAVHGAVGFLLDHMPSQMHLFVASRREPPLPLARMLAGAHLTRLSAADLKFTSEEASAFIGETMGLSLPTEDVVSLHTVTEGWAAGLQLAAIAVRETEKMPELAARGFSGSSRHLLDYLAEEVLDQQTEEARDFLLRTSILGRMCAPLSEAVTGVDDGQAMLETLERANLFVVPLDDERRWYRYHHLFSDFLLRVLRRSRSDELPGLHERACDWFESNGLAAEAVSHALAAGNAERAADLVEKVARTTLRRGELSTLRRWLEALPEDLVRTRPRLCLFYAWYFLAAGDLASVEPYLKRAERAAGAIHGVHTDDPYEDRVQAHEDSELREILGEALTVRAAVAGLRGESQRAVRLARRASGLLTEGNQFLRCIVAASVGYARRADGDVAAAIEAFAEAAEASRSVGATYVTLLAYKHLAELRAVQGRLRAAAEVCARALELAAERGGGLPAASVAHVGKGELLREWDELDDAVRHLEEGIRLGERGGNFEVVLDGLLSLARIRQASGDRAGVVEASREAERLAEKHGTGEWVARVGAWRARLSIAQGDLWGADRWLEERQLSADDQLGYPREFEHVTLARVLLAQERRDEALRLLERLLVAAEAGGRDGRVIEILILRALALRDRDDGAEVMTALGKAAALAEAEGYVRVFADEGSPMAGMLKQLLRQVRCHRSSGAGRSASPGYVAKLLAAMGQGAAPLERLEPSTATGSLVEPLSEREREILALLPSGISNKEIAAKLFVSLDTVKSHLKHLYAKLDVRNRAQAVARAEEFGLI